MYAAKYRGEDVAVKVLNARTLTAKKLAEFKHEVKSMHSIQSKYVNMIS